MLFIYKNRKIEIDSVKGTIDEPYAVSGYYLDGEEEQLTEDELEDITYEFASDLSDELQMNRIDQVYDLYKD